MKSEFCCGEGEKGFKVGGTNNKARVTSINVFDRQIDTLIKRNISKQTHNIKRNHELSTGGKLVDIVYERKRVTGIVIRRDMRLKQIAKKL